MESLTEAAYPERLYWQMYCHRSVAPHQMHSPVVLYRFSEERTQDPLEIQVSLFGSPQESERIDLCTERVVFAHFLKYHQCSRLEMERMCD
jgi:hypothetical protein